MATVVRFPQLRSLHTKVVGVTFRNSDGTKRQELIPRCRPGDPLRLLREPANPHDRCAIAVYTQGGRQLGYVGYHLSREIAAEMDADRQVAAEVVRVTGGGGWLFFRRRYGVNIRIVIS